MKAMVWLLALCAVQAQRRPHPKWFYRSEAEKVSTRGCANLTLVLDNWKYAIMTQVKDLLLHDHNTVLPDYGRIRSISDGLGDLYKEVNALKERLGELTAKFEGVEAFVEDVRAGRRLEPRPPASLPGEENATDEGSKKERKNIRRRFVIRRIKTPALT